jgi:hypothetical protein
MEETKRSIVIHPYLFAIAPILSLFFRNKNQVSLSELVLPVVVVVVATFLLIRLISLVTKDKRKAAVLVSIFVTLFFIYRDVFFKTKNLKVGAFIVGTDRNILIAWTAIFALSFLGIVRRRSHFPILTSYLNVTSIVLVLALTFNIGSYEFNKLKKLRSNKYLKGARFDHLSLRHLKTKPDIYYIILDTYARADTLKNIFGYDNSQFINILKSKGFYVAEKSHSNYSFTQLSLASSLNMGFINNLTKLLGKNSRDTSLPYQMISNNKVQKFLKANGYKFVHFSTGWGPTRRNVQADIEYAYLPYVLDEFNRVLLESTALAPLIRPYVKSHARNRILYNFEKLKEVPEIPEPTFTFAHLIIPHQPYLFDRHGNPVYLGRFEMGGNVWKYKKAYLDQLIYANKKVEEVVDAILRKSKTPPIIVIQSDHGPSSTRGWDNPSDRLLNERMGILNAYYLPARGKRFLYQSITPVNSFRLIFNYYFGANYKPLKDESYFSTKVHPYKFINVTERLN